MLSKLYKMTPHFGVSLVLVVLSFTPLRAVAFIGCIILWALYWPFGKVISSFLLRLVLAFVLTSCFQQLTAGIFWLLRISYNIPAVTILELMVFLVLVLLRPASKFVLRKRTLVSLNDVTALLVSLGSSMIIGFFMLHGGSHLQQLVRQVTTGYDNIQHVSLTQTLYEHQGYVYGSSDQIMKQVLYPNLASYPQGWSLNTSLLWHAVSSNAHIQSHPALVLALYVGSFFLWYTLIIYLMCRLILALVEALSGRSNGVMVHFGAAVFTGLAEVVFLVNVMYNGFASFLPSLLFPLALALLMLNLLAAKKSTPLPFLIEGLLISGGISFSWLLVAPAGYIAVLIGLVAFFRGSMMAFLRWLFKSPWALLCIIGLLGAASIQGVVQVLYGSNDLVNMPGGINDINTTFTGLFLALSVAAILYFRASAAKNVIVAMLSGAFMISGGVYLYQFASSGTASYFSTKAGYVAFLLIFAFGAASLLAFFNNVTIGEVSPVAKMCLILALVVYLPIASNLNLGTSPQLGIGSLNYVFGRRFLSEYSASQVVELLNDHKLNQGSFAMYKHLGFAEDITTTHFANMVAHNSSRDCKELQGTMSSFWKLDAQALLGCAGGGDTYVITSNQSYQEVQDALKGNPKATIILSN